MKKIVVKPSKRYAGLILPAIVFFMSTMVARAQPAQTAQLVLDLRMTLGEGSIWDFRKAELLFVDIENGKLFTYTEQGQLWVQNTGQRVSAVVPAANGMLILAMQKGIYSYRRKDSTFHLLVVNPADTQSFRFNDGKCDPSGRLWIGTMSLDYKKGSGSLYRLGEGGSLLRMKSGVTISNGLVWSADKRTMYYIDTPTREIVAFSYDDKTGRIDSGKVAIRIPPEMGGPDGMTIDAEGKLWIAHYGGAAVRRWDPVHGELLETIHVPAKNVTSCAFGGPDLDILFITTARQGNSAEDLQKYPYSGGLFSCKPGVKGVRANLFGQNPSK